MNVTTLPTVAWLAAKIMVLVGIGLYAIFAGIMVRQEQLMADVLEEGFEPMLRLLVWLHLVAAIGVLFLGMMLL